MMKGKKKIAYWTLGILTAANAGYFAYTQVAYRPDPRQEIERAFASQTLAVMARNIPAVELTVSKEYSDPKVGREAAIRQMMLSRKRFYRDISFIKIEGRRAFLDYKVEETLRGQGDAPDESWRREVKEEMWNRDSDDRWRQFSWAASIESKPYDASQPEAPAKDGAPGKPAPNAPIASASPAAPNPSAAPADGAAPSADLYVYNPINRRDPFKPFLEIEDPNAKLAAGERGPALRRYAVEQLKLVGVMWGEMGTVGLVETNDGGGFSVRAGDAIGKEEGTVKGFTKDSMLVEQRRRNSLGEVRVETLAMKLYVPAADKGRPAGLASARSPAKEEEPPADAPAPAPGAEAPTAVN